MQWSNIEVFKILSIVTALIAFTLFVNLLFYPKLIFSLFEIPENESAFFISRRAAMLFLGVGVLSWLIRNVIHSVARQAVCAGLTVMMFGLALLGSIEYFRGYVGLGIGLAVLTELLLGLAYFKVWFMHRKITKY